MFIVTTSRSLETCYNISNVYLQSSHLWLYPLTRTLRVKCWMICACHQENLKTLNVALRVKFFQHNSAWFKVWLWMGLAIFKQDFNANSAQATAHLSARCYTVDWWNWQMFLWLFQIYWSLQKLSSRTREKSWKTKLLVWKQGRSLWSPW